MKSISNHTIQPLCNANTSQQQSLWQSALHFVRSFTSQVWIHQDVHAHRGILAGLLAGVRELLSSPRHTAGLAFVLVIAPGSGLVYQLCNPAVSVEGWYYANNYYLLYTLSPYFMLLFWSVGTFLLFPVKYKTSYITTLWPTAYAISRLLYLGLLVDNNEEFHNNTPRFLFLIGLFAAISLLMATDYLCYRKYHLKHGTIARMQGIISMPGVSAERKLQLLEHENIELENFQQRI